MNALMSLKPSESEMKSLISAIDNVLPLEPCGADAFGAPSKKNSTGTCRIWDICCNRLAPMRLAPFSYFCTCWKVRPSAPPSFSWLIASIRRRIRTRLPTCWSMGFGAFFRRNCKRTAMADRSLELWTKIVLAVGQATSRFNGQFLDEGLFCQEFLRSRAASTGSLRECRFLDNDLHFLDSRLCGFVLWIMLEEHDALLEASVRRSQGFSL